ncbi:MAG: hypothetical protein WBR23_02310 [Candidatus Dormiibacterota bacterium]
MSSNPDSPEVADADLLLATAKEALSDQLETIDAADAKLGMAFAAGSAVVGLVAAVVALRPHEWADWERAAVVVTVLLYLAVVALAGIAVLPKTWRAGTDLEWLWNESKDDNDPRRLRRRMASGYMNDLECNAKRLGGKNKALRWAMRAVAAEALVFAALAILLS